MIKIKLTQRDNETILVHYQSWIVDGSGSTAALFTGSYDNLQDPKNYSWNLGSLVYFDKIVKEEVKGRVFYYCDWLDMKTNKLSYKTDAKKGDYDKQQYKLRTKKLKRITND